MQHLQKSEFFSRTRRKTLGQSAVEFALVVPLFLFLLFGMIDYARYYLVEQTMSHTLRKAARFASTGKTMEDPDNSGTQLSRRDSIILFARESKPGNISLKTTTNNSQDDSADNFKLDPYDGGDGGEFLTLTIEQDFKFITPFVSENFFGGKIKAKIRVVNERFN